MTFGRLFQILGGAGVTFFCCSCEELQTAQQTAANAVHAVIAPTPSPGYWNGDGVSGSPKIVVHLSEQKAYFYKGKRLVGESTVSTGKKGYETVEARARGF